MKSTIVALLIVGFSAVALAVKNPTTLKQSLAEVADAKEDFAASDAFKEFQQKTALKAVDVDNFDDDEFEQIAKSLSASDWNHAHWKFPY